MKPLRLGVAGLGTVGAGTVRLLQNNAAFIARRAGRPVVVSAICARDQVKARACDTAAATWFTDPLELASCPDVDVVVELMGGAEGAARALVEAALRASKPVVTANKALLATHGTALAALAEEKNVAIKFEAAVAGGIPIIKTLQESLAGNHVTRVVGILNGTCNFILTRMETEKMPFAAALAEAQKLGYAEADPSADIDGHDSAHKLALLAALAFGVQPDLAAVSIEGIRDLDAIDMQMAEKLGYRIKLLGVAEKSEAGIEQRVSPCLVPLDAPLAGVDGVLNAVAVTGDAVGPLTLIGRGAGGDATASAVVGDLVDLARGGSGPVFGSLSAFLTLPQPVPTAARQSRRYIRLPVADRAGVLAELALILRDEGVSVESILQHGRSVSQTVPVILITHTASDEAIGRVLQKIAGLSCLGGRPCCLRVQMD